jgi:hypothetical protein
MTVWPSLKGYLTEAYDLGTEPAETMVAVLADLMHLCDELGLSYAKSNHEAYQMYVTEAGDARDAAQWDR